MPTPYVTDGRGDQGSCLSHVRVVPDAVLALVKERGRRAGLYAPIGGT
jgi:hypothetical protein